jgi:hypothetical protein
MFTCWGGSVPWNLGFSTGRRFGPPSWSKINRFNLQNRTYIYIYIYIYIFILNMSKSNLYLRCFWIFPRTLTWPIRLWIRWVPRGAHQWHHIILIMSISKTVWKSLTRRAKLTPRVIQKVKTIVIKVLHWRPQSLLECLRKGSENEVAKRTFQGGKYQCKWLWNGTLKSQGRWYFRRVLQRFSQPIFAIPFE